MIQLGFVLLLCVFGVGSGGWVWVWVWVWLRIKKGEKFRLIGYLPSFGLDDSIICRSHPQIFLLSTRGFSSVVLATVLRYGHIPVGWLTYVRTWRAWINWIECPPWHLSHAHDPNWITTNTKVTYYDTKGRVVIVRTVPCTYSVLGNQVPVPKLVRSLLRSYY